MIINIIVLSLSLASYIDHGDYIEDLNTGLFWQDTVEVISDTNKHTWGWHWTLPSPNTETGDAGHKNWGEDGFETQIGGAGAYCYNLTIFNEYKGYWRVPNYNELNSIIDRTKSLGEISISDKFKYKNAGKFWTSTTYKYNNIDNQARVFNFYDGDDNFMHKNNELNVRCVH
jgi:hypothetical protein